MTTTRLAGLVTVVAGAVIGLAGPASADPLSGNYTANVIKGPKGTTVTLTLTPCGPDCTHLQYENGAETDLHLQGDSWTGTLQKLNGAGECAESINKDSLIVTHACGSYTIVSQLTKNG